MEPIEEKSVRLDRIATGGASIGSLESGKTVLVDSAIPGETVDVLIKSEKPTVAFGACSNVVEASPHRVIPVCENVARNCGGCDWQHIEPSHQSKLRVDVVEDCLRRIAKLDVPVSSADPLASDNYRTTLRLGITRGRAGFREAGSNTILPIDSCTIAHPKLEELLEDDAFGNASEVTLRVSSHTGERIALVDTYEGVSLPDDVVVVTERDLVEGADVFITEKVGGHEFKVSAGSFFQARPDGALQLAELVNEFLPAGGSGEMLDAYCGVGLFGVLCGQNYQVFGVESSASSVSDAGYNYKLGDAAQLDRFEKWHSEKYDVVIADPPRSGLKLVGVKKIVETEASHVAIVSCDPASLARDASEFSKLGYKLEEVKVSDCFAQTSHVESVAIFKAN